ncbi:hypothetical protein HDU93_003773 [Gonapodya sp. JEL0774]|nr:hypothetical protein HDU93_003773 [Gonapodya sp. JEL0774]
MTLTLLYSELRNHICEITLVAPAALIANQADKVSELELALLDGRRREESLMRHLEKLRQELSDKTVECTTLQAQLSSVAAQQARNRHEIVTKTAMMLELRQRLQSDAADHQRDLERATECEKEARRISVFCRELLEATNARLASEGNLNANASTMMNEDSDPGEQFVSQGISSVLGESVHIAETETTHHRSVPAPASSGSASPQPGTIEASDKSSSTSIIVGVSVPSTPSTESEVPPTPPRRGNFFAYHSGAAVLGVDIAFGSTATTSFDSNMDDYPIVFDFDKYSQSPLRDPVMQPQCSPSAEE